MLTTNCPLLLQKFRHKAEKTTIVQRLMIRQINTLLPWFVSVPPTTRSGAEGLVDLHSVVQLLGMEPHDAASGWKRLRGWRGGALWMISMRIQS